MTCAGCGMVTKTAREYHPFAACLMKRNSGTNSISVHHNLKAVVAYGMRAERTGVSIERAMSDLTSVKSASEVRMDRINERDKP